MKEFKNGSVKFDLAELNLISLYAQIASEDYKADNCPTLAKEAKDLSDKLYDICNKHGLYKKLLIA